MRTNDHGYALMDIADLYRAAGDAYQRCPSCVTDPDGFQASVAEARELTRLADAEAERFV